MIFAAVPSGRIANTLDDITFDGFGMNLPHETNGVKVKATLPAASNLRKSLLVRLSL